MYKKHFFASNKPLKPLCFSSLECLFASCVEYLISASRHRYVRPYAVTLCDLSHPDPLANPLAHCHIYHICSLLRHATLSPSLSLSSPRIAFALCSVVLRSLFRAPLLLGRVTSLSCHN